LLQQSVHDRCGTEPAFQNYRQRQEAEKARSATIERQAVQSQLQMLQADQEPYAVQYAGEFAGLIALDPDRAQHMLAQLITYMRATLQTSRAAETSLAGIHPDQSLSGVAGGSPPWASACNTRQTCRNHSHRPYRPDAAATTG
jgi:hypothetical protein